MLSQQCKTITGIRGKAGITVKGESGPYIAHALHDSERPDPVKRDNPTRNILCTAANNQLRMEDKRGEEPIALATEYGKTGLNSGHLVDAQGMPR
ncbi:type VI secretion system Vgr family protein, partial [Erwinia amylovora]|nr:type VI secretion system Vgr family protein [Erwinia amylovora]MBZ2397717.1 type VI secretion system Vgr family protein [Erwinia amylovora]MBZ2401108.1 type VI secretion system Vgr family protein [Erwinia amylovora]MBZ2404521.1 type VI secretion system Vgr family protein [Erwinia amylovora]